MPGACSLYLWIVVAEPDLVHRRLRLQVKPMVFDQLFQHERNQFVGPQACCDGCECNSRRAVDSELPDIFSTTYHSDLFSNLGIRMLKLLHIFGSLVSKSFGPKCPTARTCVPFAGNVIFSDVGFDFTEVAEFKSCYFWTPFEEERLAVASVLYLTVKFLASRSQSQFPIER